MPIPALAIAGAGFATQAISGFLGGNKQGELSKEVQDLLRANARKDRSSQFLPDKAAFDAQLKAQLDELFAKLGVNLESFNADAAARGTFTSGEAAKREFADVRAPIARAGASAIASSGVQFESLRQRGLIAADTAGARALQLLVSGSTLQRSGAQEFLSLLGETGDFATQFGILEELGITNFLGNSQTAGSGFQGNRPRGG